MNPLLLDFPDCFETDRLTVRAPRPGDGPAFHLAKLEALETCKPWMPWAHQPFTPEDSELLMREMHIKFLSRQELMMLVFLRGTSTMVASSGLHHIEWSARRFEVGYWVRTPYERCGYVTEAVSGIVDFARTALLARRVEIRAAEGNTRSWRVAEKLGFALEGTLRQFQLDPLGGLHDLRLYSKVFPPAGTPGPS